MLDLFVRARALDPHPALHLPADVVVLDLTRKDAPRPPGSTTHAIGRYDEDRAGMYEAALFGGARTLHVGIDLGAPAGTEVFATLPGVLIAAGANPEPGDYGHALVLEHAVDGERFWALYGHLSADSVRGAQIGAAVARGEVVGRLGAEAENGGWPPHLHLQLSLRRPSTHDLPGVVAPADREAALRDYPDPRWLLGPLY